MYLLHFLVHLYIREKGCALCLLHFIGNYFRYVRKDMLFVCCVSLVIYLYM